MIRKHPTYSVVPWLNLRCSLAILLAGIGVGSRAATINVSTSSQLASAVASANPGDLIVLASGNYSAFTMTRSGNSTSAITLQAATIGGAVINSGFVNLNGVSYVNLDGLEFTTAGGSTTVDGVARNVALLLNNANSCRITRCTFALSGQGYTEWVFLGGNCNNNRIDHCDFGSNTQKGRYIYPAGNATISGVTPPSDRTSWANGNGPVNPNIARNTEIDHNYFHDHLGATSESIVLGGIGVTGDYQGTRSTVEYNLFVNCDGDNAEIISTKSSTNTIRYNTVQSSAGVFSLRSGNGSSVYGNFFLCAGSGGGIKVNEMNHKVYNNYIENSDTSSYPIMLEDGDPYSSGTFAHAQVVNAQVVFNTVINPGRQVLIGHGSGTLPPSNITFANNLISGSGTLYSESTGAAVTRSQNISWTTTPAYSGFTVEDPLLATVNSLQKLSSGSPAVGAANSSYYSYVTDDMDGQTRGTPDIGADEYSTAGIVRAPLTTSDVGPASPGGGIGTGFSGYYKIVDRNSGKVAAVQGAQTTNGAPVILWTFGTSQNDQWQLVATDSGYYKLVNRKSALTMAVQSASTSDGALILQWSFGSAQNDQWKPVDAGSGYYNLVNRHSGLLLDVKGAGTTNGAPFEQFHSNGGLNQQFQLISTP